MMPQRFQRIEYINAPIIAPNATILDGPDSRCSPKDAVAQSLAAVGKHRRFCEKETDIYLADTDMDRADTDERERQRRT